MPRLRKQRRGPRGILFMILAVAAVAAVWGGVEVHRRMAAFPVYRMAAGSEIGYLPSGPAASSYTTTNPSVLDTVREFFQVRTNPQQPIAFNHAIHIKNGLTCATCHAGVTQGPDAGLPSVTICMACHQTIDTQNPQIKKLTAYSNAGQEPPWQPVYWFYPGEHLHFRHAPHIRAGVACATCHGDLAQQTVAVRSKNLTMNFCLSCHQQKGVSTQCTTCHY